MDLTIALVTVLILHVAAAQQPGEPASRVPNDSSLIHQMKTAQFWLDDGQQTLQAKLKQIQNENIAKNVIFFLGDGMSVPTVTAARIYDGQQKGTIGERNSLTFERFSHVGLSKTYCVDKQVPDSACTATAYLCGTKARFQTIGVSPQVKYNDCEAANKPENQLHSIAAWAQAAGKSAGIVTTTRVTHASPAGTYAHTANRDFESDADVHNRNQSAECKDIARQLIEDEVSQQFRVILGGGTLKFLPNNSMGERLDGRNLIKEWTLSKKGSAQVVLKRQQLLDLNVQETDYLLGLFDESHMKFHLNRSDDQPLLEEMTEVAIKMLQKNKRGYFLFVEGGRIDHGHHQTRARLALDETVQFSRAVEMAYNLTDSKDTLIVVTADHGHTITINGYPNLNNDISGLNTDLSDVDSLPYSTLSYANGPSFHRFLNNDEPGEVRRVDLRNLNNIGDTYFQYPASVPLSQETHGGGDVAIYANGPWSHLFTGVLEQNTLPALMGFAACVGPGKHACNTNY